MSGPFRIRKVDTDNWLASSIDSGGMSVYWTSLLRADKFPSHDAAQSMLTRVKKRYPTERVEIVPHD